MITAAMTPAKPVANSSTLQIVLVYLPVPHCRRSRSRMSHRYFEDFVVGDIHKPSGRVRVEKSDIIAFAKQFDPQPFHLEDEGGRKSIFGRLVASGWHTAAMTMRLVAGSEYRAVEGTIGLGVDALRWPVP